MYKYTDLVATSLELQSCGTFLTHQEALYLKPNDTVSAGILFVVYFNTDF